LGKEFFVRHRIISGVKRIEVVSDRVSYIVLRGCWCNVIVLNAHAPSEEVRRKVIIQNTVFTRN